MSRWYKVVPSDVAGNPLGGSSAAPIYVQPNGGIPTYEPGLIGNANNYYPNRTFNFTSGRALGIVQNSPRDLWEGPTATYVFPPTPMQMRFVSDNANDTLAGTGCQKVHIHYLDNLGNPQTEIVNMNGLTPVNTVATNILRINGMHSVQVGTNGAPLGNISLTDTAGVVTYGYQSAGYNSARMAVFTIPSGKTGYLTQWQCSSGSAAGTHFTQIEVRATAHLGVAWPGVFLFQDGCSGENFSQEVSYVIPLRFPALTDVKVRAISDAVNANATAIVSLFGYYE